MSVPRRIFVTCRICVQTWRAERREVMPLAAFCVLIGMLGDDLVLWLAGKCSAPLRATLLAWGGGWTTLAFGIAPAAVLALAVIWPEFRATWKATAARAKDF